MKEPDFVEGKWEQPSIRAGYPAEIYDEYLFLLQDSYDVEDDGRPTLEQIRHMLPAASYNDFENEVRLHCDEKHALEDIIHEIQHWATNYLLEEGTMVNVEIGERLAHWAEAIPIEKGSQQPSYLLCKIRIRRKPSLSDDEGG